MYLKDYSETYWFEDARLPKIMLCEKMCLQHLNA